MSLSSVLFVILLTPLLHRGSHPHTIQYLPAIINRFADTLPPLASFAASEIDTVTGVYRKQTITVKLKTGKVYIYHKDQWTLPYQEEDKLNEKIRNAMGTLQHILRGLKKCRNARVARMHGIFTSGNLLTPTNQHWRTPVMM